MSIDYKKENITLAKNLRKNSTKQENHLWYDYLSKYPVRFQRQKAIDNYIADFYCHKAKLVVELDGSQHYNEFELQADKIRTEELQKYEIKVIRFLNSDVDRNFESVCMTIDKEVKNRLSK